MNPSIRIVCVTLAAVALGALLLNLPSGNGPDEKEAGLGPGLQPAGHAADGESLRSHMNAEPTSQREAIASEVPPKSFGAETPPVDFSEGAQPGNAEMRALRAENLERRRVQIKEQIENRAVRISNELVLATGAEQKIAAVFLEEQSKLEAIRAAFSEGDRSRESRDKMRAEMDDVPNWREKKFITLFGPEMAQKIINFDDAAALQELEARPKKPAGPAPEEPGPKSPKTDD